MIFNIITHLKKIDVDVFDHHCPWVSNCIGKRNYRYFFVFVWITIFLSAFSSSLSISQVVLESYQTVNINSSINLNLNNLSNSTKTDFNFINGLLNAPVSAALAFLIFSLMLGVIFLGFYHITLVIRGLTTHEDIKNRFGGKSPFAQSSFLKQISFFLCGPQYPSAFSEEHRYDFFNSYPNVDEQDLNSENTYINTFIPSSFDPNYEIEEIVLSESPKSQAENTHLLK